MTLPSAVEPARLQLRLYLAGQASNSRLALATLRTLLAQLPAGACDLEVIDVLEDPERAMRDGVFVTPILIRLAPLPERRMLGNLKDRDAVLGILALDDGMP